MLANVAHPFFRTQNGCAEVSRFLYTNVSDALPLRQIESEQTRTNSNVAGADLGAKKVRRGTPIPHITQIAAIELQSGKTFNNYVLPKMALTASARQVTGIVVDGSGGMTVKGKQVQPETIHSAITKFCKWLKGFDNVFLVAHCGRKFDFPVFWTCLNETGFVDKICKRVLGLIDSRDVFKKCFPREASYKQEDLAKSLLKVRYEAHDALKDVEVLGKLVFHTELKGSEIVTFSFSPSDILESL